MASIDSTGFRRDDGTHAKFKFSGANTQQQHQVAGSNMEPQPIDFDECLKDSPKFRQSLRENLANVEHLESCITRTMKQLANFIETGRDHMNSHREFIQSMRILNGALGPSNRDTTKRVDILLETLKEIVGLHEVVLDQSIRSVGNSFSQFLNDDLLKLREARKSFDKISHEYDQALLKYSQPVKKQQEDAENLLIAISTAFTHTSLDLSIQLSTLQSKKRYEILNSLLSLTKAHNTFYHQGYDLFENLKGPIGDIDKHLSNIQDEYETMTRNLPSKHLMVSNNELRPLSFDNKSEQIHLEGYLFKRASNGFKVWNRRWFILKDHQLIYQKRSDAVPIVMEEDLRLLTVRPVDKVDCDRRFCFELVSPQKSHILQADSESACKTWIAAVQAGINAAFHDTEHKSRPPASHAPPPPPVPSVPPAAAGELPGSGWGSAFSLKALQQQATNKLSSLTSPSDAQSRSQQTSHHKTASVRVGATQPGRTTECAMSATAHDDGDDEEDDEESPDGARSGSACAEDARVQGRGSYAPLQDDDDDDDHLHQNNHKLDSGARAQHNKLEPALYPEPAPNSCSPQQPESGPGAPEKPQRAYMFILAMPGNDQCADCGAAQPRWASINLGITLCIECAGIHRSLGVHLSKVRSLTLDTEVWSPEIVSLMLSLGNSSVNAAYLACYRDQIPRIDADSCREDRESWIKSKYLLKKFMRPPGLVGLDDSTASNTMDNPTETGEVVAAATTEAAPSEGARVPARPDVEPASSEKVIENDDLAASCASGQGNNRLSERDNEQETTESCRGHGVVKSNTDNNR